MYTIQATGTFLGLLAHLSTLTFSPDNADRYLTYCYLGINVALQQLLKKPDFLPVCASWHAWKSGSPDMYMDIYDGNVWKDFEKYNGVDFLNNENNLALMMNFDFL